MGLIKTTRFSLEPINHSYDAEESNKIRDSEVLYKPEKRLPTTENIFTLLSNNINDLINTCNELRHLNQELHNRAYKNK